MPLYHSATVPLCHSATVSQCYSTTVLQCHSATVTQCHSDTVSHLTRHVVLSQEEDLGGLPGVADRDGLLRGGKEPRRAALVVLAQHLGFGPKQPTFKQAIVLEKKGIRLHQQ